MQFALRKREEDNVECDFRRTCSKSSTKQVYLSFSEKRPCCFTFVSVYSLNVNKILLVAPL
jgi:hypothetical protein